VGGSHAAFCPQRITAGHELGLRKPRLGASDTGSSLQGLRFNITSSTTTTHHLRLHAHIISHRIRHHVRPQCCQFRRQAPLAQEVADALRQVVCQRCRIQADGIEVCWQPQSCQFVARSFNGALLDLLHWTVDGLTTYVSAEPMTCFPRRTTLLRRLSSACHRRRPMTVFSA
jgi:hypothetical protein